MPSVIPSTYSPSPTLLAGRRILVSGAGAGLGRATALACARSGATVILLGRTVKTLEAVYDEIEGSGGAAPAIYPLNLAGASWKDYADLAAVLEREFGALDALVHCAAHFGGFTRLADLEGKEWVESLQVNLSAAYALTRHCLPLLLGGDDASVVFVTDAAGRYPRAFHGAYGVSKAALENLSATWAQEFAEGASPRFNTFDPGPMRSGVRRRGYPGELAQSNPDPAIAAARLLWLLGPDSRGVSGAAF